MANCKLHQIFLTAVVIATLNLPAELLAQKIPSIPKWQRFELTLKSSRAYPNPLPEAEVRALFVSPLGETNRVYGFWDGGKTWRVRYQPAFPGRWTYSTMCSDTANSGLHEQSGEFLCTAPTGDQRFNQHGPVQTARDNQHFEHADRTPFLWLGDAAWDAAGRASSGDWQSYLQVRTAQKFNVVQWKLPAAAFTEREGITVNPAVFQKLEANLEAANRAGLLNAIAPLWEIGSPADNSLTEAQAIALLRYCLARWDADHVAWIIAFEADNTGDQAARWQRIGRAVFNPVSHAPVVLVPGDSLWVLDKFRQERWVDAIGLLTTQVKDEDSLPWLLNGPLSLERRKSPPKPLIALAPPAETADSTFATSGLARRLLWWNLLLNTPAGVSVSARDVAEWTAVGKVSQSSQPWYQALSLPGAAAIAPLSDCLSAKDFWRLQPIAQSLAVQPGNKYPLSFIAATSTEAHDWSVIYVPNDRAVDFKPQVLSPAVKSIWFNPRTGESAQASAVANATSTKFITPSAADWVLVLEARQ